MLTGYFQYFLKICCRFGEGVDVCLDSLLDEAIPGRPVGVDRYQKHLQSQYFEFTKQVISISGLV